MKALNPITTAVVAAGLAICGSAQADLTANATATSNYIWRGLTQTENEAAIQGGLDYSHESGFYIGTWASNVNYGAGDPYSYEHDIYFGWSGTAGEVDWDVGYLYYNYDSAANFDFGEVYASLGYAGFSLKAMVLTNTEADEVGNQDFGFGKAMYISGDYSFTTGNEIELGAHVGWHDGDFAEAFNGVDGSYFDYNVYIAKNGFKFMISDTDADGPAAGGAFDNAKPKFVISYTVDIDLLN
ncbi:MAG: hypothetical protein H6993_10945 [Pseudomonadales bacterium]|nr:hypothetical protein [Pseudomonadales bacterium]MCP5184472.1 hypothetical protein [Pseudomonadales bacterium]